MSSMGKSMADIMQTPPDPSMEPMMMKMMHDFASAYMAPLKELQKKFGFDTETVVAAAKETLAQANAMKAG